MKYAAAMGSYVMIIYIHTHTTFYKDSLRRSEINREGFTDTEIMEIV
jgi:hypothetical protein